jgi:hypothetical protein
VAQGEGPEFNPQYCKKKKTHRGKVMHPGEEESTAQVAIHKMEIMCLISPDEELQWDGGQCQQENFI